MTGYADALRLYEEAVANGQSADHLEIADRLLKLAENLSTVERANVVALSLHLRTLATLVQADCSAIEGYLAEIGSLGGGTTNPVIRSVHAIIAFCSYHVAFDGQRLSEAINLFAGRGDTGIARLESAAAINEVRTHALALGQNVAGHSADRVEALARKLGETVLSPRLEGILVSTLADFYGRLTIRYGDLRFVRQGLGLLEPIARGTSSTVVADTALGGVMQMMAIGLEYDGGFSTPRDLIARAQCRVRQHRAAGLPASHPISEMAHGLGLRARFDWERAGKRSGVQRALGYLRVAAQIPSYATFLATTLRVAYEAGLGDHYLTQSLRAFETARAAPGFRATPPDDANFASTLMLIGNVEGNADHLDQAMSLYERAIAMDSVSGANISRNINLATAAKSYARLRGGARPLSSAEAGKRLYRGLDAVIMAGVLDRPGSTHAALNHAVASSYFALFKAQLGTKAAHEFILRRTVALLEGQETFWPIGFTRFLTGQILEACEGEEPDCAILRDCAFALERAKMLLQVVDLCDGRDEVTDEVDRLFAASVAILRVFIAEDRDDEGLGILDRLTAGFVRTLTGTVSDAVDPRVVTIVRDAIAGAPLSQADAALIRRSPLGDLGAPADIADGVLDQGRVRLDLVQADGKLLALRQAANGLSARQFEVRGDAVARNVRAIATGLAAFIGDEAKTCWIAFRNVPPDLAHDIFNELRALREAAAGDLCLFRHGGRTLGGLPSPVPWQQAGKPPRFLIVHSPHNAAPALHFGFQFTAAMRATGATVVELAFDDCTRAAIEAEIGAADIVLLISHGVKARENATDRILLSGDDYVDAGWLIGLGRALEGKTLFLIACNSGHFNARLTHDDISLAPLALALGARSVFSTLRSVDELTILIFVRAAMKHWQLGSPLHQAFELARRDTLELGTTGWDAAHRAMVGGGMAARAAYRYPLGTEGKVIEAEERADIDIGWSFVLA